MINDSFDIFVRQGNNANTVSCRPCLGVSKLHKHFMRDCFFSNAIFGLSVSNLTLHVPDIAVRVPTVVGTARNWMGLFLIFCLRWFWRKTSATTTNGERNVSPSLLSVIRFQLATNTGEIIRPESCVSGRLVSY